MDKWLIRNVTKAEQIGIYGALGYQDKLTDYHKSIYPIFTPKFSETLSFELWKSHRLPQLQKQFHQYLKLQIPFNKVVYSDTFQVRYYSVLVTSSNCYVSNSSVISPVNNPSLVTGEVVDNEGNNPFIQYSAISKSIRRYFQRTHKFNGGVLGSVIENPINSNNILTGQKYINVHLHLLVQICSERDESSAIQRTLQHLVDKKNADYSVGVRPYRDKYSHELIKLTGNSTPSDIEHVYQSLSRFLLGYFNKQRNKLPASLGDLSAWKHIPQSEQKNILLSIYNSISKHLDKTTGEITKGIRLHYQRSFKRANRRMNQLIKFNHKYWNHKLNHAIYLDLITRKFTFWENIKRVTANYASNLEQDPTAQNVHITGASEPISLDSSKLSIDSS